MGHLVFYSCSSTLDLSFFMMLLSICEPLLCHGDPSWWSRHIDFQVYIAKLQPGFRHVHVLQWFFTFEPTFGMMSCPTLQAQSCIPLCLLCESAHRLRDLLSTLQICKRVVHDILKKLLSICGTVITFLSGHCQNCKTVVSLGLTSLPFFIDVLSNFAMATLSPVFCDGVGTSTFTPPVYFANM